MKKSDIYLIGIMYAILGAFLYMTLQLKVEARIYPLFVMGILFILVTMYSIKCGIAYSKTKEITNDFTKIFADFEPKQFFGIIAFSVLFIVLINIVGFYSSTVLYLVTVLLFLKVPKVHIGITTVVFTLLMYGVFTMFLRVPLPTGFLF